MQRLPGRTLVAALAALAALVLAVGAGTAAADQGFGPGLGGPGGGLKGLAASLKAKSAFEADVAKRLDTTVAKIRDAQKAAAKTQVDTAREDEEITAAEAETLKGAIDDGSLPLRGLGRASDVAKALGTTTAKLNGAYREARRAQALARVDQAVKDGDLEAAEAATLKNRIEGADFPGYSGGPVLGSGLRGPGLRFGGHGFER